MTLFALVAVLLFAAAHGLLVLGLGPLYRRWMRWAFLGLAVHELVAWMPPMLWGREARYAAPAWFNALFVWPATAVAVSVLLLIAFAPLWVPWTRTLRRKHEAARRSSVTPAPAPAPTPAPAPLRAPAPTPAPAPATVPAASAARAAGFTRRQVLALAAAAPPAALLASGPAGLIFTETTDMPYVHRLELAWPNLPAALDGLRLAQVSDIHVGIFVDGAAVRRAAEAVQREKPDVFLVTGDVIDDVRQLPETMEALSSVRARLGAFACLGNHEYYAGLRAIRDAFDRSPIHMLVNEATQVRAAAGATVEISAVDYPIGRGRMTDSDRFGENAERALVTGAPGGDFRLHLAHHPHAWDAAAARGADLTLSGHTHGGQIAVGGRPLFGAFFRYMRGLYTAGDRKLFVHSGTGHWLPLRIGCPAEVAIITLRRAAPASAAARAA
ncbi:MAG TPA: metallophosphoesterase [Myxococcota bacterium]|jgi:hypothetical protein|nr:metallophosphoesterase [Myxococcota bacterium]